ncbi:cyclin-dependent kinase [Striga asiatica]|uniref:Cyclin-dependent kinase n=1 Tax=Striga asiatica TaxID=4170 RepID=A0A5A7QGT0_STRAF|nr:cyclin-dependent kinase [Striga asiatica]
MEGKTKSAMEAFEKLEKVGEGIYGKVNRVTEKVISKIVVLKNTQLHGDEKPVLWNDDRGDGSVDDLVEGVGLGGEWVGVEGDVFDGEAVGRGVAAGLVADVLTCGAATVDLGGFCVRKERKDSL